MNGRIINENKGACPGNPVTCPENSVTMILTALKVEDPDIYRQGDTLIARGASPGKWKNKGKVLARIFVHDEFSGNAGFKC